MSVKALVGLILVASLGACSGYQGIIDLDSDPADVEFNPGVDGVAAEMFGLFLPQFAKLLSRMSYRGTSQEL